MSRAVVVINPLSGRGRYANQVAADAALARSALAAHGVDAVVLYTTGRGDAHRFAREAVTDGFDLVAAWGGDGTVNEVASALVHTSVPLAIVPAGSGNGLAGDLGIPFDPLAAFDVAARGRTMPIDAGELNDALFFNIAGIGIDALIATRFATRGLRRRGPLGYLNLSVTELVRYRAQAYRLTIDGEVLEQSVMLLAVANGRQYGNRLLIAPGARLDDGLFEVIIVGPLSIPRIAWKLPSLFRGTLASGTGITMRAARDIRIEAPGDIPYHVDGEPHLGKDEVVVRMHPLALLVRAPDLGR